jgi:1-acyl-sn-glycerol-3-phosphate acyltransferase
VSKFHGGAFTAAARSDMPVVTMAIHGTRAVLPPEGFAVHRLPIRVEILAVLSASDARQHSRELIARAIGEPLAP